MLVRIVLWSLADSKTTIGELRRYLRDESVDEYAEVPGLRFKAWISDEYLRLSAAQGGTCIGDSGGPSLVGDTIVGLTAFTVNDNCAGVTYAQRIDIPQTRSFIDSFLP